MNSTLSKPDTPLRAQGADGEHALDGKSSEDVTA